MIPIKDVIPPRSTPWMTITILVAGALELATERWLDVPIRQTIFDSAVNIAALWIFADNIEDRLGRYRFLALYLLCGFAGAAAAAFVSEWSPLPALLSTGAVAGVLGAYFVLYPQSRVLTLFPLPVELFEVPAAFFLATFVIVRLPGGLASLGEVGAGLAAGAVLCLALRRPVVW